MATGSMTLFFVWGVTVSAVLYLWGCDNSVLVNQAQLQYLQDLSVFHPAGFHDAEAQSAMTGNVVNRSAEGELAYFEGWYVKVVSDTGATFAVILGAFYGRKEDSAFIIIIDSDGASTKYDFPLSQFWASTKEFDVTIGENHFSTKGISLDLANGTVKGDLEFRDVTPWPISYLNPGVMGWFAWIPFLECYHGVPSLNHRVYGTLEVHREHHSFTGSDGYIEKDRGRRFPSHWVWLQSNSFGVPDLPVSLSASIARVPLPIPPPLPELSFSGFIVGFLLGPRLYIFNVGSGAATTHFAITPKTVEWTLQDGRHQLQLHIHRGAPPKGKLYGPRSPDRMEAYVEEALNAKVDVKLFELPWLPVRVCGVLGLLSPAEPRLLFSGSGKHTGLEVMATSAELQPHPALAVHSPLSQPLSIAMVLLALLLTGVTRCCYSAG